MAGDVVDLIMQDHREVERRFDELGTAPEKPTKLVPVLTTPAVRAQSAEEAEVHPAAAAEADVDLIDAVSHHVEEESKVLPGLRTGLGAERLAELERLSRPAARNTSATSPRI